MLQKLIQQIKKNYWLILAILLGAFLRYWNLAALLHWTFDEDVYAFQLKWIVVNHHIPLIGVSAAPIGMELGPLFYWVMAIPFWLGGLSPVFMGAVASAFGVATIPLVYIIAKRELGKKPAIFSSLIYAASFLVVMFDKHFWSVTPQIIISLLVILSLLKIIDGKYHWFVLLGLTLGFAVQSDLLSVVYFPLVLITLWYYKVKVKNKFAITGVASFFVLQLPLVLFDIRHDFHNTRALLKFIRGGSTVPSFSLDPIIDSLMQLPKFWSRLIYVNGSHDLAFESTYCLPEIAARDGRIPYLLLMAAIMLLLFFIFYLKKSWKKAPHLMKIIFWQLIIVTVSLFVYGIIFKKSTYEFYLISTVLAFVYVSALFLDFLWQKGLSRLVILLLVLYITINSWAIVTATHSFGYKYKSEMIKWALSVVGDESFSVYSLGYCHKYEGHRYLMYYNNKVPISSYTDPDLAWIYNEPKPQGLAKMGIVFVSLTPEDQESVSKEYGVFSGRVIDQKIFGGTKVLIANE